MKVQPTAIPAVKVIESERHWDERGFFAETYNHRDLKEVGLGFAFVQENHSYSREEGTVRGLHFQRPPCAQDKLVRVTRGSILDVAVDLRRGSPTYGQHVAVELSDKNWRQLFVPVGFAHGFCTLEAHTELVYRVTDFYSQTHDAGIRWDDPDLSIEWPVSAGAAVVSSKDGEHPLLRDFDSPFTYRR